MTIAEVKRVVLSTFPDFEVEDWEWYELALDVSQIVGAENIEKATDVILKWEAYRVTARRDAALMRQYAREHNLK